MTSLRWTIKSVLTRIGAHLPTSSMHEIETAYNFVSMGHWMKSRGYLPAPRLRNRMEVFRMAAESIQHRQVLYLEFGVWRGETLRFWSDLLKNPKSLLHGFDSFYGLPEDWKEHYPKGTFSVNGDISNIADSRVSLFKGWFRETLPQYQLPHHEVLFVNCDADLYSSARTILDHIGPHLRPGDFIYFDEFDHADGERRAFEEFLAQSDFRFSLVAYTICTALFMREPDRSDGVDTAEM